MSSSYLIALHKSCIFFHQRKTPGSRGVSTDSTLTILPFLKSVYTYTKWICFVVFIRLFKLFCGFFFFVFFFFFGVWEKPDGCCLVTSRPPHHQPRETIKNLPDAYFKSHITEACVILGWNWWAEPPPVWSRRLTDSTVVRTRQASGSRNFQQPVESDDPSTNMNPIIKRPWGMADKCRQMACQRLRTWWKNGGQQMEGKEITNWTLQTFFFFCFPSSSGC